MKKVSEKAITAFYNGAVAKFSNTEVANRNLYLFGNHIAKIVDGYLWITNAGWPTATTKERLNTLSGVHIQQKAGKWFLNGVEWDGVWTKVCKAY